MEEPGGRGLGRAAASGAVFGSAAAAVGGLVLLLTLLPGETSAEGPGAVLGFAIVWLIGTALAVPTGAGLGAIFGLGNGAIARTRWGRGWLAVFLVAAVLGGTLAVIIIATGGGASGLPAFALVPALASAAQLRYEQRRTQRGPRGSGPYPLAASEG